MYGLLHSLDLGHVLFAAVVFMMAFGMVLSVLSFDNRVGYQLRGALLVGFAIDTHSFVLRERHKTPTD